MKLSQIAAQCYTVREFMKTPSDIAASLKQLRAIGYQAVQISGIGPIDERELAAMIAGEGLVCCGTHEPGQHILNETPAVIERLRRLNCTITAYPYPSGVSFNSYEDVLQLARQLNQAGRMMHEAGLILCYHNHQIEFRRFGCKTALEILYEETDPRYLQGEPDTYWVQYGGGDPVAWCRRLAKRLPIIHLKDYMIKPDNSVTMCELGQGNLNWKEIIAAAEAAGCQWFVVEQDTCAGDPFDALRTSFDYLKEFTCGN